MDVAILTHSHFMLKRFYPTLLHDTKMAKELWKYRINLVCDPTSTFYNYLARWNFKNFPFAIFDKFSCYDIVMSCGWFICILRAVSFIPWFFFHNWISHGTIRMLPDLLPTFQCMFFSTYVFLNIGKTSNVAGSFQIYAYYQKALRRSNRVHLGVHFSTKKPVMK